MEEWLAVLPDIQAPQVMQLVLCQDLKDLLLLRLVSVTVKEIVHRINSLNCVCSFMNFRHSAVKVLLVISINVQYYRG